MCSRIGVPGDSCSRYMRVAITAFADSSSIWPVRNMTAAPGCIIKSARFFGGGSFFFSD